ncbi:MAG: D-glycero-beta-D-manno-heptose 1-phosphate adenylyltransferase [Chloracidobacterium sp.]|nr:D-glycero-beta-D-manno-heptose 1-phosphate adenylyltransferase [Chloracidobacterium sp.]
MEKIVFTNGCFDILHPGHIDLLSRAKALGTKLIVGINSDASVASIKGHGRPVNSQKERSEVLLGLRSVDEVLVFYELTPENLIKQIKPDVLVKGGDWQESEIIGADFVRSNGGEVFSLPLKDGFSTSNIIKRMEKNTVQQNEGSDPMIASSLNEHIALFKMLHATYEANIAECAELIFQTFQAGKKVLICGNGGSAADAQHIATELVCRYESERKGLPAIALTTDTSALTAIANDFDFERVFARQVEALASDGDLLIAISTSGNSPNIISAVMTARSAGCKILGMTGANGKKLASLCDACFMVPSKRTARIQEAHITIAHIWCEIIDTKFADTK